MIIGVCMETFPDERRVALIPEVIAGLTKQSLDVIVESGAGREAGILDSAYEAKGAKIVAERSEVFASADVILQVRSLGANPDAGRWKRADAKPPKMFRQKHSMPSLSLPNRPYSSAP